MGKKYRSDYCCVAFVYVHMTQLRFLMQKRKGKVMKQKCGSLGQITPG